jgi:hypothetical protein
LLEENEEFVRGTREERAESVADGIIVIALLRCFVELSKVFFVFGPRLENLFLQQRLSRLICQNQDMDIIFHFLSFLSFLSEV